MPVSTYDTRCYELAELFLQDEPDLNTAKARNELALAIQGAIEDWIEMAREDAKDDNDTTENATEKK